MTAQRGCHVIRFSEFGARNHTTSTSTISPSAIMNHSRALGLGYTLRRTAFSARLGIVLLPSSSDEALLTTSISGPNTPVLRSAILRRFDQRSGKTPQLV